MCAYVYVCIYIYTHVCIHTVRVVFVVSSCPLDTEASADYKDRVCMAVLSTCFFAVANNVQHKL